MGVSARGFKDCKGFALMGPTERRRPRALRVVDFIFTDEDVGTDSSRGWFAKILKVFGLQSLLMF